MEVGWCRKDKIQKPERGQKVKKTKTKQFNLQWDLQTVEEDDLI